MHNNCNRHPGYPGDNRNMKKKSDIIMDSIAIVLAILITLTMAYVIGGQMAKNFIVAVFNL